MMTEPTTQVILEAAQIMEIIPHRFPFLLVDRILELIPGEYALGIKNVSVNEPFFQGHFPGEPVMPGVIIVEALAQVGAVAVKSLPAMKDKLVLFAGIDEMRFRKRVLPGDCLRLEVKVLQLRSKLGSGEGIATVNGEVAARGKIMFGLMDI